MKNFNVRSMDEGTELRQKLLLPILQNYWSSITVGGV